MIQYGVSEGALLRKDGYNPPEVYWEQQEEWHVLPDLEAWTSSRPVMRAEAEDEFPGVDLDAEVTVG